MDQSPETISEKTKRLERLSQHTRAHPVHYNAHYSKLVRRLRFMLPIVALMIIGLLFAWPNMQDQNIPTIENEAKKTLSGRKELLNPVFESVDSKNQPYKVIAKRAIQGETDENLIMLEQPTGKVTIQSGEILDVIAINGAYRQDIHRLFLKGAVELVYGDQYKLETEELDIDMKQSQAWSKHNVRATGSIGVLTAAGLEARNNEGLLIFTGPAQLILNDSLPGL